MRVDMVDPQGCALREIADKRMTRDDVALSYAFALRQGEMDRIAEVNQAIIDRWSMSALFYIKAKAWARVVERLQDELRYERAELERLRERNAL